MRHCHTASSRLSSRLSSHPQRLAYRPDALVFTSLNKEHTWEYDFVLNPTPWVPLIDRQKIGAYVT